VYWTRSSLDTRHGQQHGEKNSFHQGLLTSEVGLVAVGNREVNKIEKRGGFRAVWKMGKSKKKSRKRLQGSRGEGESCDTCERATEILLGGCGNDVCDESCIYAYGRKVRA
jgi:hypothetical protein